MAIRNSSWRTAFAVGAIVALTLLGWRVWSVSQSGADALRACSPPGEQNLTFPVDGGRRDRKPDAAVECGG